MTLPDLKPGDVINTVSEPRGLFGRIFNPVSWLQGGIRAYQRGEHFKVWDETHTMVFFAPDRIFSMTWPKGTWETWDDVQKRRWRVYRPVFALSAVDLEAMRAQAERYIGRPYDLGQNLAIAWSAIWGLPPGSYSGAFDWGQWLYSCSNSTAMVFETPRILALHDGNRLPPFEGQLFTQAGAPLNDNRVCPACYSNTPPRFAWSASWDGVNPCA